MSPIIVDANKVTSMELEMIRTRWKTTDIIAVTTRTGFLPYLSLTFGTNSRPANRPKKKADPRAPIFSLEVQRRSNF